MSTVFVPSYLSLPPGELDSRARQLNAFLAPCRLCPRACRVDRLEGEIGYCRAGSELTVSSAFPHLGEEPPLVGSFGSGTIFITHCNLRCVFCQNFEISHLGRGERASTPEMAGMMLRLQAMGCHNINFVSPTHYTPQIVQSVARAAEKGLSVPLVYNCSGYESVEVIRLLEGIFDIYMPDVKYMDEDHAVQFSNAPGYPEIVQAAVKEMHRQVGDLVIASDGTAQRGLLVRHLVMPNDVASSASVLRFISEEISVTTYINIMDQYRPEYRASAYPSISRRVTAREYSEVVRAARDLNLRRGF